MNDRHIQLPHDRKAEHACLSAVLARGLAALDEVLEHCREPADFFVPTHAAIFAAMLECADAGEPITAATIASEMRRLDTYERLGGDRALASLRTGITTRTVEYAKVVRRESRRREFSRTLHELADLALAEPDMSKSLAQARRELDRLDSQEAGLCIPITQAVAETRAELERRSSGEERLIASGFRELDELGESEPGDLVVLGAESGTGKTAFALGLVRNGLLAFNGSVYVPRKQPVPALVISGEMGLTKLVMRWISDMTGFDGRDLKAPAAAWYQQVDDVGLSNGKYLDAAFDTLASVELSMTRPSQVRDIDTACAVARSWAARMRRKHGDNVSLKIIVDYLQLLKGPAGQHRNARSDEIEGAKAVDLKALADDTRSVVIALSQITLEEKRKNLRPTAGDLRGSKMIRNAADRVWLLYRPWICQPDVAAAEAEYRRMRSIAQRHAPGVPFDGHGRFEQLEHDRCYAEIGIDKSRGGASFTWLPLEFTPEFTRFLDAPTDSRFTKSWST